MASLRALRLGMRVLSALSPRIASRVAGRFWFMLPRPRISDESRAFLATGERVDVDVNGSRVAAWRWKSAVPGATGRAVILVHGWGGYGAQYQAMIESLVRAGFQAVTFDAPSHGVSGASRLGPRHSTLFEFADALRVLAERTPPVAVIAHSGGCTAVAWALSRWSLRVPRVVFIAPFASAIRYMGVFRKMLGLNDATIRRFREWTEREFAFKWEDLEVPEMADRITTPPTLVVHDRDDKETPWQDGSDIAAKWPRAELRTTTGLGHVRILRDHGVVEAITGFVARANEASAAVQATAKT